MIPGARNEVADFLSLINIITHDGDIDFEALVKDQLADPEIPIAVKQQKQQKLSLKKVKIPNSSTTIYCDISTEQLIPYVPNTFRTAVMTKIHNLSHPSGRATAKMITSRYIWPYIKRDCKAFARTCIPCQKSKISRHVKTPLMKFLTPNERSHLCLNYHYPFYSLV